jgi:hypothetical protein
MTGDHAEDPPGPTPPRPEAVETSCRYLELLSARSPESTRYPAKREIARGGMGAIIEVLDAELRRTLAMKAVLGC